MTYDLVTRERAPALQPAPVEIPAKSTKTTKDSTHMLHSPQPATLLEAR